MIRTFALLAFVLIGTATPARAAIDQAGADKLKAIVETVLEQQKNAYKFRGSDLLTKGKVTVEAAGSYYAITLPHIAIVTADGSKSDVGMIAINAVPGDSPRLWKMSVALPVPITFFNKEGKPDTRISIGGQRTAGVWSEDFQSFVKLDAAYEDIRIENPGGRHSISKASLRFNLEEKAPGLWSGPMDGSIENYASTFADADGNVAVSFGRLDYKSTFHDLDAAQNRAALEKLDAFTENTTQQDLQNMSGQQGLGLVGMMTDMIRASGDGFTTQTTLSNLDVKTTGKSPVTMHADALGFGFDVMGLKNNDVRLVLRAGFSGLKSDKAGVGLTPEMNPADMNLDVAISKIPLDELIDLGTNTLKSSVQNPAMAEISGMQAVMALPQLLTTAGTTISFKDTRLANDMYRAVGEGTVTADMQAKSGATAQAKVAIAGLDTIIDSIKTRAQTAEPAMLEDLKSVLATLMIMDSLGEDGTTPEGRKTETFNFTLNEQGQMIINNMDLDTIIPKGDGAAPAPTPTP